MFGLHVLLHLRMFGVLVLLPLRSLLCMLRLNRNFHVVPFCSTMIALGEVNVYAKLELGDSGERSPYRCLPNFCLWSQRRNML